MGEQYRKQVALKAKFAADPWCIYCGDPAESMEHMPSKSVFGGGFRPNEMVFPCCNRCNHGTRDADHIAGFLSSIDLEERDPVLLARRRKMLDGVNNNIPDFLAELMEPVGQQTFALREGAPPQNWGVLNSAGPILTRNMTTFAAKLGFAMHYEKTGRRVGPGGGVLARWFTNKNLLETNILEDVSRRLWGPETLRQGEQHAGEHFAYHWIGDEHLTAVFGLFRRSFGVLAIAGDDVGRLGGISGTGDSPWLPGSFRASTPAHA